MTLPTSGSYKLTVVKLSGSGWTVVPRTDNKSFGEGNASYQVNQAGNSLIEDTTVTFLDNNQFQYVDTLGNTQTVTYKSIAGQGSEGARTLVLQTDPDNTASDSYILSAEPNGIFQGQVFHMLPGGTNMGADWVFEKYGFDISNADNAFDLSNLAEISVPEQPSAQVDMGFESFTPVNNDVSNNNISNADNAFDLSSLVELNFLEEPSVPANTSYTNISKNYYNLPNSGTYKFNIAELNNYFQTTESYSKLGRELIDFGLGLFVEKDRFNHYVAGTNGNTIINNAFVTFGPNNTLSYKAADGTGTTKTLTYNQVLGLNSGQDDSVILRISTGKYFVLSGSSKPLQNIDFSMDVDNGEYGNSIAFTFRRNFDVNQRYVATNNAKNLTPLSVINVDNIANINRENVYIYALSQKSDGTYGYTLQHFSNSASDGKTPVIRIGSYVNQGLQADDKAIFYGDQSNFSPYQGKTFFVGIPPAAGVNDSLITTSGTPSESMAVNYILVSQSPLLNNNVIRITPNQQVTITNPLNNTSVSAIASTNSYNVPLSSAEQLSQKQVFGTQGVPASQIARIEADNVYIYTLQPDSSGKFGLTLQKFQTSASDGKTAIEHVAGEHGHGLNLTGPNNNIFFTSASRYSQYEGNRFFVGSLNNASASLSTGDQSLIMPTRAPSGSGSYNYYLVSLDPIDTRNTVVDLQLDKSVTLTNSVTHQSLSSTYNSNNFVTCFLPGVRLAMEDGLTAVEDIRSGQRIWATGRDGVRRLVDVVWTGSSRVENASATHSWPVRIKASAIADGVPSADVLVTPEHSIYVDGKLIPSRMLVNGRTIIEDRSIESYDYYHVETAQHSLIEAEGLPTESYLDTGNRSRFAQKGSVVPLRGRALSWGDDSVMDLSVAREDVEPVWQALNARAKALGVDSNATAVELVEDADLHLLTESGYKVEALRRVGNSIFFMLPAHTKSVRLISRSMRLSEVVGPYVDDRRELGVLVGHVRLWSGETVQDIDIASLPSALGWHDAQPTELGRWTNGKAHLSVKQNQVVSLGAQLLEVEVLAAGPYLKEDAPQELKDVTAATA